MTATRMHATAHLHPSRVGHLPAHRRHLRWRPVMALRGVVIAVLWGGCLWALIVAGVRAAFGQPDTTAGLIAAGLAAAGWAVCMIGDRGRGR